MTSFVAVEPLILRMHHLQPLRAHGALRRSRAAACPAAVVHLRCVKWKKRSSSGLPRIVADGHLELRAITKASLDCLDHALHLRAFARAQIARWR